MSSISLAVSMSIVCRHPEREIFKKWMICGKTFPGPALIPEDARGAAEVEQWVSLVNTAIDPCLIRGYFLGHIVPKGADGQPDRAAIVGALPAMQKQIDVLDKTVARTGYLAGAGFTLADINLMPVLYYVQRFPEGGEMVQSAKSLSAYFAHHSERRSYKASFPPPLVRLTGLEPSAFITQMSLTRAKAIFVLSGDQVGLSLDPTPCVRLCRFDPSGFMT